MFMLRGRSVAVSLWISGAKTGTREQALGPALFIGRDMLPRRVPGKC